MNARQQDLTRGLSGRYVIERELGHGGMATVWLARDLRYDRMVALKVLRPELAASLGGQRFLREIMLAARLQHPHVVPVYDSGEIPTSGPADPPILWFTMPWIDGESLRERLGREGRLAPAEAIRIAREVARGLRSGRADRLPSVVRERAHRRLRPRGATGCGPLESRGSPASFPLTLNRLLSS